MNLLNFIKIFKLIKTDWLSSGNYMQLCTVLTCSMDSSVMSISTTGNDNTRMAIVCFPARCNKKVIETIFCCHNLYQYQQQWLNTTIKRCRNIQKWRNSIPQSTVWKWWKGTLRALKSLNNKNFLTGKGDKIPWAMEQRQSKLMNVWLQKINLYTRRNDLRSAGEWKMLVARTKTATLGPRGFSGLVPHLERSSCSALGLRTFFRQLLRSYFFTS